MSSLPVRLLNTLIYKGPPAFRSLIRKGIRSEWFQDPEIRRAWALICDHFTVHHTLPSPVYIQERMPHFPLMEYVDISLENPTALLDLIREEYLQAQMYDVMEKGLALNESRPGDAAQYVRDQMQRLTSLVSPADTIDLSSSVDDIITEYETATVASSLGLEYPWPQLHHETLGMHPEQLLILFGRPKSMKTFMALHIAVHAYLVSGARVLIISREMSKEMMRKRIVALMAKVAYGPWRKGALSEWDREAVYSMLYGLTHIEAEMRSPFHTDMHPGIRIASGHSKEYRGLDLVAALVDEYMPDLVVDDGFYLASSGMDSRGGPMDWRVITSLTQRAKSIASLNKIVYLATTQANRAAAKDDNIKALHVFSYADSFAQDCDLALRVMKVEENKRLGRPGYLLIGLPGYREGTMDAIAIHAVPCTDFSEIRATEMAEYGIDEELVQATTTYDDAHFTTPAGPDRSCDIVETEIPAQLDINMAEDIPGAPAPTVKRSPRTKKTVPRTKKGRSKNV